MSPDKLVHMANQIATFFGTQPHVDQVARVEAHLRDYWEPSMRAQLVEIAAAGHPDLSPLAAAAARNLGAQAMAAGASSTR
jgi:formate dehydrogenase subunit delta